MEMRYLRRGPDVDTGKVSPFAMHLASFPASRSLGERMACSGRGISTLLHASQFRSSGSLERSWGMFGPETVESTERSVSGIHMSRDS